MIPWISDAEALAKAGEAVVAELGKARTVPSWPDMHESMLELHAVLAEWAFAAAATEGYVRRRLRIPGPGVIVPARYAGSATVNFTNMATFSGFGGLTQSGGFVERTVGSANEVLDPKAPFAARWSRARRRVARRGLRTMLRVYAPDLLSQVESAMSRRADWVQARRSGIDRWLDEPHSRPEIDEFLTGMHSTYDELARSADALAAYIRRNFPLGGAAAPGSRRRAR